MAQQAAVEYLVDQLLPKALTAEQYYHIEQAKQIEMEQKEEAYKRGWEESKSAAEAKYARSYVKD